MWVWGAACACVLVGVGCPSLLCVCTQMCLMCMYITVTATWLTLNTVLYSQSRKWKDHCGEHAERTPRENHIFQLKFQQKTHIKRSCFCKMSRNWNCNTTARISLKCGMTYKKKNDIWPNADKMAAVAKLAGKEEDGAGTLWLQFQGRTVIFKNTMFKFPAFSFIMMLLSNKTLSSSRKMFAGLYDNSFPCTVPSWLLKHLISFSSASHRS